MQSLERSGPIGKESCEDGPSSKCALHFDKTIVLVNDFLADGKSEAAPPLLAGVKRSKDLLHFLRWNAGPRIPDFDRNQRCGAMAGARQVVFGLLRQIRT